MTASALALNFDYEARETVVTALKADPRSAKVIALRTGLTPRTVENLREGRNTPHMPTFFKLAAEIPELRNAAMKWLGFAQPEHPHSPQAIDQTIRLLQQIRDGQKG